jgi:leader peptidase (prepilin peptidase) / N-methyltransferase
MPEPYLLALAALLGAAVGSFLNVCAYRWPEELSVVSPPSKCPACDTPIRWFDNVPVLGWLWLRGRCRSCRARISVQYPLVELATALLWAGAVWRLGLSWEALSAAVFFTLLLGIALSDARTYIIPDEFTLGGLAIGLALSFAPGGVSWVQALLGALLGGGLLWLVAIGGEWAFGKEAMGGGDIKMMAMVGAFLGPLGVLLTIFLGALLGTLIFAPISLRTGKPVPFGIFLALGAFVTHLFGGAMVGWYVESFLRY